MGLKIILEGADYSQNALPREKGFDNLTASDFEIGKNIDGQGGIATSGRSAISPLLSLPKGAAVYFDVYDTFDAKVNVYQNGELLDVLKDTVTEGGHHAIVADADNLTARIAVRLVNEGSMSQSGLVTIMSHYKYIEETSDADFPVVLGNGVSSSGLGRNSARASIGPIQVQSTETVGVINGMINIIECVTPYSTRKTADYVSGSYSGFAKSQTLLPGHWYLLSYKNASETAPTISEVLADVSFSK